VVLAVGGLSILAQGQTRRRGSVRHTPREDVERSREVTRDDDKLELESEVTGPGGRSAEREGEIEKKEGHVEFEGEAKTSTGREREVEGEAARRPGGRTAVVADVDRNYGPDRTVARRTGPAGSRTAVVGPYGGRVHTSLPYGSRTVTWRGHQYYHHGHVYYRPYRWRGSYYYWAVPPPYGFSITVLPSGAVVVRTGGVIIYYHNHVYYQPVYYGGAVSYQVVPAPEGAALESLPPDHATVTAGGTRYFYYQNTFYRLVQRDGKMQYVVVTKPDAVVTVAALLAEFEIAGVNNVSYFVYEGTHYLPYTTSAGQEMYIVVDKPLVTAPAATTPQAQVASTAAPSGVLTVPVGTELTVRIANDLHSDQNQTGDRFTGYLDSTLYVDGRLAAPRGSKVYGRLVEVEKAGSMSGTAKLVLELTDIEVGEQIIPITTNRFEVTGESSDTLKKVGGGAALGAIIGGIAGGGSGAAKGAAVGGGAGTVAAAATEGDQVYIASQTLLSFRLEQPLNVQVSDNSIAGE
jgi:hypothetical protein